MQMHLILQVFIILQSFKRLKHFLDHFLQIFDQRLVFNPRLLLVQALIFLGDPLLFLIKDLRKQKRVPCFRLHFALPNRNHLPQLSHRLTPRNHLFQNVLCCLLKLLFKQIGWDLRWLRLLLGLLVLGRVELRHFCVQDLGVGGRQRARLLL